MKVKKIGFTLIELLVVISIIGILSGIGIAQYKESIYKAKKAKEITEGCQACKEALADCITEQKPYCTSCNVGASGFCPDARIFRPCTNDLIGDYCNGGVQITPSVILDPVDKVCTGECVTLEPGSRQALKVFKLGYYSYGWQKPYMKPIFEKECSNGKRLPTINELKGLYSTIKPHVRISKGSRPSSTININAHGSIYRRYYVSSTKIGSFYIAANDFFDNYSTNLGGYHPYGLIRCAQDWNN